MGAWGHGTFDNDDASDWVYDLAEAGDYLLLRRTFKEAQGDYLEAPEGSMILAAAEVVLALAGEGREGLPDEVAGWVSRHPGDVTDLRVVAAEAVAAVLGDNSELKELWEDSGPEWLQNVTHLHSSLLGET